MLKSVLLACSTFLILAGADLAPKQPLNLDDAIAILKAQNLEVKIADYDLKSAQEETDTAFAMHWGRLDFVQKAARSDDAGNVFGFKLASREATFGDFGFNEFTGPLSSALWGAQNDAFSSLSEIQQATGSLLSVAPHDLNYPDDHNFFQSKLTYMVPLYAGGQISGYTEISEAMEKIKQLDKSDVLSEKVYQTRKSFYDMALLASSLKDLNTILNNIDTLETMIETMIAEGYAKEVDLLEIQAKKADVTRLIHQMKSNQKLLYHFLSFLLDQEVTEIALPSCDVPMPLIDDATVLRDNLDIRKAEVGMHIHNEMVSISRSGYLPQIGAFGEVSTADNTFLGDANDHKAYTVGAQLTWNLFSGGSDASKVEKARIEELKMKTQLDLAKKGIALKLAQIRTEIASYDEEMTSLLSELQLADKIYESYATRYRENLASMNDVIIQQSHQIEKILELKVLKNKRNERIFALEKLADGE